MFNFIKRLRAEKTGEQAGQAMASDIDEYVAKVIVPRITSGLEVFQGRLATVWDNADYDPKIVALAERKIFEESFSNAIGEFEAMVRIHMYKWDSVLDQMPELREVLDKFIHSRISDRAANGRLLADKMLELTVAEIDHRKQTASENVGSPHAEWKAMETLVKRFPAPS